MGVDSDGAFTGAAAEDAVKFEALNDFLPSPGTKGYGTVVRTLRTPFVETWQAQRELARRDAARLRETLLSAVRDGRVHELIDHAVPQCTSAGDA